MGGARVAAERRQHLPGQPEWEISAAHAREEEETALDKTDFHADTRPGGSSFIA